MSRLLQAEEFCVAAGRVVKNGKVQLVRFSPVVAKEAFPPLQSYDLVIAKNEFTYGEVVYVASALRVCVCVCAHVVHMCVMFDVASGDIWRTVT